MRDFVLMTDSCCDLPAGLVAEADVCVLPLSVVLEGKEYRDYPDHRELDPLDFYAMLRRGALGTTSAANADAFRQAMEPALRAGRDVLCISFSSALSTTHQSAVIAAGELREQYPGSRIVVIDSLCASLGQGMLVYLAYRQKAAGRDLDAVADYVRETIPRLCHWFTVDDLNHLRRGGRVSAATAMVGTMLQFKPILHVDDQGRLINVGKARGRKASIQALLDKMEELHAEKGPVFISHGDCAGEVEEMAAAIRERFGAEEIVVNFVGPVIGNHTGSGVIALFFLGDHR